MMNSGHLAQEKVEIKNILRFEFLSIDLKICFLGLELSLLPKVLSTMICSMCILFLRKFEMLRKFNGC